MNRFTSALVLTALGLTLASCGGEKSSQGAGTAGGEILPGSTSDAMLPLDRVRSQAPLAPKAESSPGAKKSDAAEESDATESDPGDAPLIAAPAAEAPAAEE